MKKADLYCYRTAIGCAILFFIFPFQPSKAQSGKNIGHFTYRRLCGEFLYFYNDSIAFYNEGCENHSRSISMLKWKREGDTITCKAVAYGDLVALKKVEKIKGTHCEPRFLLYDIDGKPVSCEPVFIREEKDSTTLIHISDKNFKDVCTIRKNHFITMPLNVFPLYSEQLRLLPNSPYDTIKVYLHLPAICLQANDTKFWCYPEFTFRVIDDQCLLDVHTGIYWE